MQISLKQYFLKWLNLSKALKWWDVQVRPSVQENTQCIYKYNLQILFCRAVLRKPMGTWIVSLLLLPEHYITKKEGFALLQ